MSIQPSLFGRPARPDSLGAFEFVVLATQRAAQLMRGCIPRVEGAHKPTVIAQFEVALGKVRQVRAEAAEVVSVFADDEVALATVEGS
jgi:DNA-directed RNA polymerase subunit K/omega